jgi:hypothetical protein
MSDTTTETNIPAKFRLTPDEEREVAPARDAMAALQKTFDQWVAILRGWKVLRDKADRMGGRDSFMRLMDQQGFRMNPKPVAEKVVDKSTVTKGLQILERLADVLPWHEQLAPKQRREWASPSTIFKHCPVFNPKTQQAGQPLRPKAQTTADSESANTLARQLEQSDARLSEVEQELETTKENLGGLVGIVQSCFTQANVAAWQDAIEKRAPDTIAMFTFALEEQPTPKSKKKTKKTSPAPPP